MFDEVKDEFDKEGALKSTLRKVQLGIGLACIRDCFDSGGCWQVVRSMAGLIRQAVTDFGTQSCQYRRNPTTLDNSVGAMWQLLSTVTVIYVWTDS